MRPRHIWMALRYRWQLHMATDGGPRERLTRFIVWMLPRSVVYWAAIRVMAHASATEKGMDLTPDTISVMNVLEWWDEPRGVRVEWPEPILVTREYVPTSEGFATITTAKPSQEV